MMGPIEELIKNIDNHNLQNNKETMDLLSLLHRNSLRLLKLVNNLLGIF